MDLEHRLQRKLGQAPIPQLPTSVCPARKAVFRRDYAKARRAALWIEGRPFPLEIGTARYTESTAQSNIFP